MSLVSEYYCVTHDAGPWTEDALGSNNKPIVKTHRNLGCKVVEDKNKPQLRGKKYWEHTEIENEFTNYMIEHYDEMLHIVIHSYKGSKKSCLIKEVYDDIR